MSNLRVNKRKRKRVESFSFKSETDNIIEEMKRSTAKRLNVITELNDQIEKLEGLLKVETPTNSNYNIKHNNDTYINEIEKRIKTEIISLRKSLKRAQAPSPIEARLLVKLAEVESSIF